MQPWTTSDGGGVGYGQTYDLDDLPSALVNRFATIVVRRSPFKSRPPAQFALASRGTYYDVWRRTPGSPIAHLHLGLGAPGQPSVVPACRAVGRFAAHARRSGSQTLRYAARGANGDAEPAQIRRSTLATLPPAGTSIGFDGPGSVTAHVTLASAGSYRLWVQGDAGRSLRATVDGSPAGTVRNASGGDGNTIAYDVRTLTAGPHTIVLTRGGGSLAPGDGAPTLVQRIALAPLAADAAPVHSVPLAHWRTLCGRPLDWVEAL